MSKFHFGLDMYDCSVGFVGDSLCLRLYSSLQKFDCCQNGGGMAMT